MLTESKYADTLMCPYCWQKVNTMIGWYVNMSIFLTKSKYADTLMCPNCWQKCKYADMLMCLYCWQKKSKYSDMLICPYCWQKVNTSTCQCILIGKKNSISWNIHVSLLLTKVITLICWYVNVSLLLTKSKYCDTLMSLLLTTM